MSDIFREVDEDLKHEQYKKLWDKYGAYIIGAAAFIALGTLGVQLWDGYQENQRAEQSDRYLAAIEAAQAGDDPAAAATSFGTLSQELAPGYGVLAKFQQAATLLEAGDKNAAIGIYDSVATQGNADPLFKGLARIRAAYLLMDTISSEEMRARLVGLDNEAGPWRHASREILAFSAFKEGDLVKARSDYQRLSVDPFAPANMKARAGQMIAVIGSVDLPALPEAKAGDLPSPASEIDDDQTNGPTDGIDGGDQ